MPPKSGESRRFALCAWFVLAYNLLVIVWGAVVRATGSGAGCGEHWPLCQGVVIPHGAQIATLIEFAHRASSGVAVMLVVVLAYLAFRRFPTGHAVRWYAVAALCLTFSEGIIGAGLVLFGWTGSNASLARFAVLALHLTNTFMLLAALALAARFAVGEPAQRYPTVAGARHDAAILRSQPAYIAALIGTLLLAVTGTVAALADTLFPTASLGQGLRQDFSAASSYLVRLRIVHPILAVIVGAFVLAIAANALTLSRSHAARRTAIWLLALVIVQAALGALNLLLLSPVVVQVLHLLVADLVWIALVLLSTEILTARAEATTRGSDPQSMATPAAIGASAAPAADRQI